MSFIFNTFKTFVIFNVLVVPPVPHTYPNLFLWPLPSIGGTANTTIPTQIYFLFLLKGIGSIANNPSITETLFHFPSHGYWQHHHNRKPYQKLFLFSLSRVLATPNLQYSCKKYQFSCIYGFLKFVVWLMDSILRVNVGDLKWNILHISHHCC